MEQVTIVGTGLIGASFGLALRRVGFYYLRHPGSQFSAALSRRPGVRRHRPRRAAGRSSCRGRPRLSVPGHRQNPRHDSPSRPAGKTRRAGDRCRIDQMRNRQPGAASSDPLPVPGRTSHGGQRKPGCASGGCRAVSRPSLGAHAGRPARARNSRGARVPPLVRQDRRAHRRARLRRSRPAGGPHLARAATGVHRARRRARNAMARRSSTFVRTRLDGYDPAGVKLLRPMARHPATNSDHIRPRPRRLHRELEHLREIFALARCRKSSARERRLRSGCGSGRGSQVTPRR